MESKAEDGHTSEVRPSFEPYDARPWIRYYSPGIDPDLGPLRYGSIGELVRSASRGHADKPAFTLCMPDGACTALTFTQIDLLSDWVAAYLRHELQLAKGDRVAIQCPNSLTYPVFSFGAAKAGCVIVNLNPLYTVAETEFALADSAAKLLLIDEPLGGKLDPMLPRTAVKTVLTTALGEDLFATVPYLAGGNRLPLVAALQLGKRHLEAGRSVDFDTAPDDLLALQYTGGTTGRSKGAMLTHGNLAANIAQGLTNLEPYLPASRTTLTALPMYHIFAMGMSARFYSLGGHNVIVPSARPAANLRPAFEQFDITHFSGVNTLFASLLAEDWFRANPPRQLRVVVGGGAPVQNAVAQRWEELVGTPILQAYGLTEASPGVTANPVERPKRGSIGVPYPGTWVRIVDDLGSPVAPGQPGEMIVKGPQVMKGYWGQPEATGQAMWNGWLHTGDIALMDDEGYFYIVDRKKDLILVSGFNVYPKEVEEVIAQHPAVAGVAVVGVPDDATGEAVRAYVVTTDPALTEEDVREHCRQFLTNYKVPKRVVFRDELPMSTVGKVLRKELRTEALREIWRNESST